MTAESSSARAKALTMSGLVPGLRPPPTRPGAKGILFRRAVNISSQQQTLLEEETSWLGSDGKPNAKHKLVPDEVLKQLQKQASRNKPPSAPPQREDTPPGPAFDDTVPEKTATHKAKVSKAVTPKAVTPRKSQVELQEGIRETRALSQAAVSSPPRPAEQDAPQPAKKAVDAPARADGGKEDGQERDIPAPEVVEQQVPTPAPVAAEPVAAEPVAAEPVAVEPAAAEPLPSIELDNVAEVVQPAQTEGPVAAMAEREPEPQAEAKAKQPEVEQERQPVSEAAPESTSVPEPEVARERSLAQETRSSPPVLQFRREVSEEWPDELPSDVIDGNDDNDDYANEMDKDSDGGSDSGGEVYFDINERNDQESRQSADEEDVEKDKERLPDLLPPTPQRPQTVPPAPAAPTQPLESVASRQINSPYHGRSPDLGTSSPAPIDVELPDMLDGTSQPRSHLLRRGIYSDSVGEQPSSSPTPKLPRSSLRRAVPQEQDEPREIKSDDHSEHLVSEVAETISTNADASAKQQPQPQRRRMKPAGFPPKAPAQTRPPPTAPGVTIGRDPSRQLSLAHPPIENIKRTGIATSDMSTSPILTPNFQRTETYSHAVAENRTVSVVATPASVAHAPTSTPIPVAVAVAASSPPVRVSTYNNTPVSQQHMSLSSKAASPNPSLSRTWMMPFELFTTTYPDYRGDLEDFLRACYSLLHSSPGALPSFVFDDIVHAFLDYIEYVQTLTSGSPQNLTQWYNLHATNLVCNQNVVTRVNVASILNAYPEEVKAIQTMTPRADNAQATVSIAAHSQSQGNVHFESAKKSAPVSSQAEQPGSHESLPPGRPFPFEMGHHHHHQPSPAGSSGPSNSILHNLDAYGNSNSTDSGGDLLRARLAQSQSIGLSQSQDNLRESVGRGHVFGPTQSSWESPHDNRQLPLPSSPVPSAAVPAGMDKRAYLLRSLEPVAFAQPSVPFTQDHGSFSQEISIEETPARPVSSTRKRVHQQFQESTPQQQRSASKNQKTPASTTTKNRNRATPAGTVSAKKPRSVGGAATNSRSPQQPIVVEERAQDVPATFDMAWDDDEDDDGDMDFETSFMSVQSAAEARRPPPKATTATTPRSAGVSKERRRATIAASDIGMVARMAAAEEREAAATKRVLPASMKRASLDGQPPRKKKKVAKRLSFANFLEREIGPKPRPA